jgi:hypothetical protein
LYTTGDIDIANGTLTSRGTNNSSGDEANNSEGTEFIPESERVWLEVRGAGRKETRFSNL